MKTWTPRNCKFILVFAPINQTLHSMNKQIGSSHSNKWTLTKIQWTDPKHLSQPLSSWQGLFQTLKWINSNTSSFLIMITLIIRWLRLAPILKQAILKLDLNLIFQWNKDRLDSVNWLPPLYLLMTLSFRRSMSFKWEVSRKTKVKQYSHHSFPSCMTEFSMETW